MDYEPSIKKLTTRNKINIKKVKNNSEALWKLSFILHFGSY